jgi:hypothetical protein
MDMVHQVVRSGKIGIGILLYVRERWVAGIIQKILSHLEVDSCKMKSSKLLASETFLFTNSFLPLSA